MALKWGIFAKKKTSQQSLFCSFCGKDSASVKALIAGPAVFICNECVDVCIETLGADPEWCRREMANLQRLLRQASSPAAVLPDQD